MMEDLFRKLRLGINLQGCMIPTNLSCKLRRRFLSKSSKEEAVEAFTLIEMIIAITVFTIFIGFAMATYLTFHRAQQEAAVVRSLTLEAESTFDLVTEALRENMIDYGRYADEDPSAGDILYEAVYSHYGFLSMNDTNVTNTLYLIGVDGTQLAFEWDDGEGIFTMQVGDEEPIQLHADGIAASFIGFEIFPHVDPYESENISEDDFQFQPIVQVAMTFSAPGHVRDEVELELQTSITSRFYQ